MVLAVRIMGIGVVLALFAAGVLWTDLPEVRYARYSCQYNLIYNQTGSVDLAVIGSSRTLQGVGAEVIADELQVPVVYNLAKNWRGQGINYAILTDLIANREVDTILVEANLPESGTFHAHFFLVGTIGDWLRSNAYRSGNSFDFQQSSLTLHRVVERVVEQGSLVLADQLNAPRRIAAQAAETGFCRTRDERVRQSYLDTQAARYHQYYVGQTWSWDLHSDEASHDFGFYKAMADLAEAHEVELVFYHINQAYYSTLDPEFAAVFEVEVGAPILIPPPSLTREIEEMGGYADTTHMTATGREVYSRWLANALIDQRQQQN